MKRPAILVLLLGCASLLAAPDSRSFEKTFPLPRTGEAKLDFSRDQCTVLAVSLQNYPSHDDIEKARKDPDDKTWMWWNFHVENGGDRKCKIQLWVEIYDKSGNVLKTGDRSDTVDPKKYDDNIRLSTRMRTIDIVDAPRARVRAEIGPKD